MKKDIKKYEDIVLLVDTFYATARKDVQIGQLFETHLAGHWEEHLEKLHGFWNTVVLREPDYYGKPIPMHVKLELTNQDFQRWVEVWCSVVDDLFSGENAERAKYRGKKMADAFYEKLNKK